MRDEPVAWGVWEGNIHDMFFTKEDADEMCRLKGGDARTVPLYLHPADLTDEEILREAYFILMKEQKRKAQEK